MLLPENEIYDAIALAMHHNRNLSEGAGVFSIMATCEHRARLQGKNIVLQMTGCSASPDEIRTSCGRPSLITEKPGSAVQIKIFTTGGTIDKIYFDQKSEYQVGDPQAKGVLERANVVLDYEVESILRKDSLDLTSADRELIRRKVATAPQDRIIITHGTDTMIATAGLLKDIPGKTIVMTGSMYPAQFHESDAVFNIGCAVTAAQTLAPGVYIAMNGRILNPEATRKNVEMNRFEEID